MGRLKKPLALLICLVVALALLAGPAFAKGSSGGGRSSFSSGSKGVSSSKSYSSGTSSYSSKPSGDSAATSSAPSGGVKSSTPDTTAPATSGNASSDTTSAGKGYTTDKDSFSTPRQGNPPALTQDYQTGKSSYSTGTGSLNTGRQSYSGTWDRSIATESDRFPQRQPVGVFGSPPQAPYYYHNNYWGMPLWAHMFFTPNYYHTPWGYHYYAPRLLTWIIVLALLGGGGFLLYRFLSRSRSQKGVH